MLKFYILVIITLTSVGCSTTPSNKHCVKESVDEPWTDTFCDPKTGCKTVTFHTNSCIKYACDKGYRKNKNGRCVIQ